MFEDHPDLLPVVEALEVGGGFVKACSVLPCLFWLFKTPQPKATWGGKGKGGRNLARNWSGDQRRLLLTDWLSHPESTAQKSQLPHLHSPGPLPRDSAACSGRGLLHLVQSRNAPQTCPQDGRLTEAIPQCGFCLPGCVKLTTKISFSLFLCLCFFEIRSQ